MRKKLVTIVGAMALSVSVVIGGTGVAFAGSPNHTVSGTRGTPSCVGLTNAFFAQYKNSVRWSGHYGIGNFARSYGAPVFVVETSIRGLCGS